MRRLNPRAALSAVLLALTGALTPSSQAAPADTARTAAWFDAARDRPPLVRQFLQRMPKGADLHSHLSGAVYAESYIDWAAQAGYCADTTKLELVAPPCVEGEGRQRLATLPNATYNALIDRMSTRNLPFAGKTGHDQFFDAFAVFGPASDLPDRLVSMVAELADRAAAQHTRHLELMITLQGRAVRKLGATEPWPSGGADSTEFARRRQWLLDHGLPELVAQGRRELDTLDAAWQQTQACGTAQARPGCAVSVRWLQQTTRTGPPEQVFAQLVYAFELARADRRVVGLNLVAPEDHPVALRDYRLQMEMIGFLSRLAPDVRIALHAGELALGLVPPEHLRHHIRDAVEVAGAHRIGHAVDIGYEFGAIETMRRMKARGVAAEVCLTSNDVILGIKGRDHPLMTYLAEGVPVVFASDDEGISRIDLSNEYQRAALTYGLGYRQLKQISRNSLHHSFLPGESLWRQPGEARPVAACARDVPGQARPSAACRTFLDGSERARQQWALEADFERFERDADWTPVAAPRKR